MKLPKLNQSGIAHILAPIAFIALFAGVGTIVLLKSNAQTPLKVVKKYTQNAPQLYTVGTPHTSYHANIHGVGKVVVLNDLKLSQTGKPAAEFYNKSVAKDIPTKYPGYKVRVCVDIRVVKVVKNSFNQLVLDNFAYPGSPSIFNNVSPSKKFFNRCTPYSVLPKKKQNQADYQSTLLASADAVLAYVRNITIEVAK